jgi:plasmid stabilization system protein ParE
MTSGRPSRWRGSGRHAIFFEADDMRILVVRVLHDRMDYRRHLGAGEPDEEA